jgi:hypothetical protein
LVGAAVKSERYVYYACSKSLKEGRDACPSKSFPKPFLEAIIIERDQPLRREILDVESIGSSGRI